VDFDVKVYTLLGNKASKTTTNPAAGTSLPLHIVQQATKYLEQIERRAIQAMLQVGGKAMHELDYSSRSLMQFCKTRHPLCSMPRGYLIACALLP